MVGGKAKNENPSCGEELKSYRHQNSPYKITICWLKQRRGAKKAPLLFLRKSGIICLGGSRFAPFLYGAGTLIKEVAI